MTEQEYNIKQLEKSIVNRKLKSLKMTTLAGNEFDADEISQGRMTNALVSSHITYKWKLSDNTVITIDRNELQEVLDEAILLTSNIITTEFNAVNEVISQTGLVNADLELNDGVVIEAYINDGTVGTIVGSYAITPTGRSLYDSLDGFTANEPMETVLNEVMSQGVKFNLQQNIFYR